MGEATDDCAVVVNNVSKNFGDVLAIDNVSFKVKKIVFSVYWDRTEQVRAL